MRKTPVAFAAVAPARTGLAECVGPADQQAGQGADAVPAQGEARAEAIAERAG